MRGIQLRQVSSGTLLVGNQSGQVPAWNQQTQRWEASSFLIPTRSDPVFVEDYLRDANGNVRTACILALARNLGARNFVLPAGDFAWVGGALTQAHGLRPEVTFWMYGFHATIDVQGLPTGQQIMFLFNPPGVVGRRIHFYGGRLSLVNCLTSRFGYAIGIANASGCRLVDIEADCTLVPAATSGGTRWGLALFGADASAPADAGADNGIHRCKVTRSQIQGCGAGRSAKNVQVTHITAQSPLDYAISVVTILARTRLENILIDSVTCYDAAGSGVAFAGGDGGSVGEGVGLIRNIKMSNIQLAGSRTDDLDFGFIAPLVFFGGVRTENIELSDIASHLDDNDTGQSFGMNIGCSPDQIAASDWQGLTIRNFGAGVVNGNDPTEQIVIDGIGAQGVVLDGIRGSGRRGLRLNNLDQMTLSNIQLDDGSILIAAKNRNLSQISLSNVNVVRKSNFLPALLFSTAGGGAHDIDGVRIANAFLRGHGVPALETALAGGSMSMLCSTVDLDARTLSAETLAGIRNAVGCLFLPLPTILSVPVPAIATGAVGYSTVSTVGTRLAGIAVHSPLGWNPQSQVVPAGPGGALLHARFSAPNTIECCFLGPLSAGTLAVSFWTP